MNFLVIVTNSSFRHVGLGLVQMHRLSGSDLGHLLTFSTLMLKFSFSQTLSLHSQLSLAQSDSSCGFDCFSVIVLVALVRAAAGFWAHSVI